MAHIEDRWFRIVTGADGRRCRERTPRHGNGLRWRARYLDPDSRSFAAKVMAEKFLSQLLETWCCLVPECRHPASADAPVLLCRDHLDLLLSQVGRKRLGVHAPVVYFIRNGSQIKFGWTTNLKGRLRSFSLPMSAVALMLPGGLAEENLFHHRFRAARDGKAEWFEATAEIERFIVQGLDDSGADAVSPEEGTARSVSA